MKWLTRFHKLHFPFVKPSNAKLRNNLVPRFFRKDPDIGWSRASSKIDRPRVCGESIKLQTVENINFCKLLPVTSKYLLIFVYFICFEFTRTFLHFYQQSYQETKQIVTRSALLCYYYSMLSSHSSAVL
jgi:hypothetical protein